MISCPALVPEITAALTKPVRTEKARVTITLTGVRDAKPLPIAKISP
jgi:hypothetical protein